MLSKGRKHENVLKAVHGNILEKRPLWCSVLSDLKGGY